MFLAGVFFFSLRNAKANVTEGALRFGRRLSPIADAAKHDGDVVPIQLNGQRVLISRASTQEAPERVLDLFEAHCNGDAGALGSHWKDLSAASQALSNLNGAKKFGTLRTVSKGDGIVMCFVKGASTPVTFAEAVGALTRTGDLGALGKLRYAYVNRSENGSRVITAWTEDSFNVDKLSPADGSEPDGSDPDEVGRIPGAKRLLTARVEGSPFGLRVYRVHSSPRDSVAFYQKTFEARGWLPIERSVPNTEARAFVERTGSRVIVSAQKDPESDDTLVSFEELGVPERGAP